MYRELGGLPAARRSRRQHRPALASRLEAAIWALAALRVLGACGDPSSGLDRAADRMSASLGVRAVVRATTASDVEISAAYLRVGEQRVELGRQVISLSDAAPQQATMSLDLTACLSDAQRATPGPACDVQLRVRLLRGATLLDEQVERVAVRPGDAAVAGPLTLYEVQTVRIDVPGSPNATSIGLNVGDSVRLSAQAVDATGSEVSGRSVQWSSANPVIAQVDAATGVVTAVTPGSTAVQAAAGGKSAGQITVNVSAAYRLTVTKTGGGDGTVITNPARATYPQGSIVSLVAAPDAFSYFAGWSGGGCGTAATCAVTMSRDQSLAARFELQQWNGPWGTTFSATRATATTCGWTVTFGARTSVQITYSAAQSNGRPVRVQLHAEVTATPTGSACSPDTATYDVVLQGTAAADGTFSVQNNAAVFDHSVTGTLQGGAGQAPSVSGRIVIRYVLPDEQTTGAGQATFTATPQLH